MITTATSTTAAPPRSRGNLDDAAYGHFRARVALGFAERAADRPLFTTDVDLWPIYLESFPEAARQHHNCTACRHFLQRYGGLATIGEHGEVRSAVWSADEDPDPEHRLAVADMERAIRRAKITGVFLSSVQELGTGITGEWTHLAVAVPAGSPARHRHTTTLTALQKMAELRQDHATVLRALDDFPLALLEQVVELLERDALYRAEKVLGPARWLRDLASVIRTGDRENLVWRAVATAPAGFCHPRSSMVGTLLEDLAAGLGFDAAAARFRAKMHPLSYQRPQAPPSAGQIAAAEDLVAKLGIAAALPRRFARLDEIETVWRPTAPPSPSDGVFGHLLAEAPAQHRLDVRVASAITWTRFVRDVLWSAVAVELRAPALGNYCALLTAVDPDAPPILQWDQPDARNRVSWYVYSGGSTAAQWGVAPDVWVIVEALALQPSMWGARPLAHHGQSAIAILRGARDGRYQSGGGGLFPEILRTELHGARATIEAYSLRAVLTGYEEASACGLRFGDSGPARLRVTTRTGSRFEYMIDRWD